jgi:hypothetical protein
VSMYDEMSLITKIRSLQVVCNAFDGLTTFEQRRELVRGAVSQIPDVTYTVRDGKNITIAQQFEKVYGVAP